MYENLQEQHLKLLEQREREKNDEIKRKIGAEKASRDKQLKEEKTRKRHEEKDQAAQEAEMVTRLKSEMEQERCMMMEKKR